ncbi:MAG: CoA-binding protein [Acidobacteriia bacterium]|nr:CoA-binding protein [Terriglobia bacterium]
MTPQGESPNPQTDEAVAITDLLASAKSIAVVGLSSKSFRPSYGVARYLQSAGYRIIPVNPNESSVLGEKCYARLEDIPEKVDIVDIFRRSELVPEIVDGAIGIGARAVWMQEGVVNEPSAERARRAGLFVVMDLCIAQELHKRHL